jgi:DNA repair protein RadC
MKPELEKADYETLLSYIVGNKAASSIAESGSSLWELGKRGCTALNCLDIGEEYKLRLDAAFELARRRYIGNGVKTVSLSNPKSLANHFRPIIGDEPVEVFAVAFLDARNSILSTKKVFVGTLNQSLVHPREVFRDAISLQSATIAVAHNHPSGNPEPSHEDIEMTKRLCLAGKTIGIPVLDHVILGDGCHTSLRETHSLMFF